MYKNTEKNTKKFTGKNTEKVFCIFINGRSFSMVYIRERLAIGKGLFLRAYSMYCLKNDSADSTHSEFKHCVQILNIEF